MNGIEEEMLISLWQIYNLMYDSFKRIDGYSVEIKINNTIMTLVFNGPIKETNIEINFKILIISNTTLIDMSGLPIPQHMDILCSNPNDTLINVVDKYNTTCLFNLQQVVGCFLPIIPVYADKTKLE
jgi:hypothetical protein